MNAGKLPDNPGKFKLHLFGVVALLGLLLCTAVLIQWSKPADNSIEPAPEAFSDSQTISSLPPLRESPTKDSIDKTSAYAAAKDCVQSFMDAMEAKWTDIPYQEHRAGVVRRLSLSSSSEHLHVAALLESDRGARMQLLKKALAINPWDPMLLWSAVQNCSDLQDPTGCPLRDWEDRLIAVDGQNSESWARIAANRHLAGESDAALLALRNAAAAADSSIYWPEMIQMFERGYVAGGNMSFPERAGYAAGVAPLPSYNAITTMCQDRASKSRDWGYACLAYGQFLEERDITELTSALARSIQQISLIALGEEKRAEGVKAAREAYRATQVARSQTNTGEVDQLIILNPKFFHAFIEDMKFKGERQAREDAHTRIIAILARQPELVCNWR